MGKPVSTEIAEDISINHVQIQPNIATAIISGQNKYHHRVYITYNVLNSKGEIVSSKGIEHLTEKSVNKDELSAVITKVGSGMTQWYVEDRLEITGNSD